LAWQVGSVKIKTTCCQNFCKCLRLSPHW